MHNRIKLNNFMIFLTSGHFKDYDTLICVGFSKKEVDNIKYFVKLSDQVSPPPKKTQSINKQ